MEAYELEKFLRGQSLPKRVAWTAVVYKNLDRSHVQLGGIPRIPRRT